LTALGGHGCLLQLRGPGCSGVSGCPGFLGLLAQPFLFLPLADVHHLQRFSRRLRRGGRAFASIRSGILTFYSGHATQSPWQDSLTAGG
jgi:hypothetical protein